MNFIFLHSVQYAVEILFGLIMPAYRVKSDC